MDSVVRRIHPGVRDGQEPVPEASGAHRGGLGGHPSEYWAMG